MRCPFVRRGTAFCRSETRGVVVVVVMVVIVSMSKARVGTLAMSIFCILSSSIVHARGVGSSGGVMHFVGQKHGVCRCCCGGGLGLGMEDAGGDVAQLVEHRTGTPPTQVRFPGTARDFSPRVKYQCRLSYGVRTPPCTIACIYICAHVKDPVVYVISGGLW